jgi:hypothetical protein
MSQHARVTATLPPSHRTTALILLTNHPHTSTHLPPTQRRIRYIALVAQHLPSNKTTLPPSLPLNPPRRHTSLMKMKNIRSLVRM